MKSVRKLVVKVIIGHGVSVKLAMNWYFSIAGSQSVQLVLAQPQNGTSLYKQNWGWNGMFFGHRSNPATAFPLATDDGNPLYYEYCRDYYTTYRTTSNSTALTQILMVDVGWLSRLYSTQTSCLHQDWRGSERTTTAHCIGEQLCARNKNVWIHWIMYNNNTILQYVDWYVIVHFLAHNIAI
jgi:hypothetical protein